jgi:hypothetical protein
MSRLSKLYTVQFCLYLVTSLCVHLHCVAMLANEMDCLFVCVVGLGPPPYFDCLGYDGMGRLFQPYSVIICLFICLCCGLGFGLHTETN